MSKLYRVNWTGCCYVWAKNKKAAHERAERALEMDGALAGAVPGSCSPATAEENPREWHNGLPYGKDPTSRERTVGVVIREMRKVEDE
jgi:hypothetical protein